MQRIIPYLSYADPGAAIAWLSDAFGFAERLRYTGPDGTVSHAELELSGDTAYGVRRYRARDLEGRLWMFAQRLREVAPAEWGATTPERRP